MKNREPMKKIGGGIVIAVVTAFSPAGTLAADLPAKPAERAARLESARAEIALTRSNIVLILEQLGQIRHAEDPRAQFQRFVDQLTKMKERAKLTQERAQLMKRRGDAYFAEGEALSGTISDPVARGQAEAAYANRKAAYDQIILQMQLAGKNFKPLLAELENVKTLLQGERSQERIVAAKDLFMQANWHCVSVQRTLMAAERDLDSLATDFSTHGQSTPTERTKP